MQVRLLGPFLAEIDKRSIEWLRRRDRQVFKYLILSPERRVSREQLLRLFWRDAKRNQAAQSLRSVCSNIRKALGAVVGSKNVAAYFRTGEYLSIDLRNVIVDVDRFTAHADAADAEYERGRMRAADAEYRRAVALYHGDLLDGDAHEPWVAKRARALKGRHAIARNRIADIANHDECEPAIILSTSEALTLVIDMYVTARVELPNAGDLKYLAAELIRLDREQRR